MQPGISSFYYPPDQMKVVASCVESDPDRRLSDSAYIHHTSVDDTDIILYHPVKDAGSERLMDLRA